jgi:hypothetical protein
LTASLAAQHPTAVAAVDDQYLVLVHVTASVGLLVTLMVQMPESCERVVQRAKTAFQVLLSG